MSPGRCIQEVHGEEIDKQLCAYCVCGRARSQDHVHEIEVYPLTELPHTT